MSAVARAIEALRSARREESSDPVSQLLYERWLKHPAWKARSEALPLLVGVDPAEWHAYLDAGDLAAQERDVWASFRTMNRIRSDDELISVSSVHAWSVANNVGLSVSFTRLYDFIRQATFQSEASAFVLEGGAARSFETAEEVEIVLGAALSLVSKMPERCRDENGFIDGTIVADLILGTAARWFPLSPPSMSPEQMARLIDRWLE